MTSIPANETASWPSPPPAAILTGLGVVGDAAAGEGVGPSAPALSPRPLLEPSASAVADEGDAFGNLHAIALAAAIVAVVVVCAGVVILRRMSPRRYLNLEQGDAANEEEAKRSMSPRANFLTFELSYALIGFGLISAGFALLCYDMADSDSTLPLAAIGVTLAVGGASIIVLRYGVNVAFNVITALYGMAHPDAYEITVCYEWHVDTSIPGLASYFLCCQCARSAANFIVAGERAAMTSPLSLHRMGTWWGGKRVPFPQVANWHAPRPGLETTAKVYAEHPELAISSSVEEITAYIPTSKLALDAGDLLYVDVSLSDNHQSATVLLVHDVIVKKRSGGKVVAKWIFPAYYKLGVNQFQTRVFEGTAALPQHDPPQLRTRRAETLERCKQEWRWRAYTPEGGLNNEAWPRPGSLPSALNVGDDAPLLGMSIDTQDEMPVNEYFGSKKARNFYTAAVENVVAASIIGDNPNPWLDAQDATRTWTTTPLKEIEPWTDDDPTVAWKRDEEFALEMTQGCWPDAFAVMETIPSRLGVHLKKNAPLPEGDNVNTALRQRRLLLTDLRNMERYTSLCQPNAVIIPSLVVCVRSPVTPSVIRPACILLLFSGQPDQYYTPADPEPDWVLAKTHARCAMANMHQAVVHALRCHFCTEPYSIAMRRCLSSRHPIYKMLIQHVRYTCIINFLARVALVAPGTVFDKVSSIGGAKQGFILLMCDEYAKWHPLAEHVPSKLRAQGLMPDQGTFPDGSYAYRDAALPIWKTLEAYVRDVILGYYKSEEDVSADSELADFMRELATDGFPAGTFNPSKFKTRAQLIDLFTTVIWVASGRHAAVNFLQYQQYGYGLNYPLWMLKAPPAQKGTLPSLDAAIQYMCTQSSTINQAATVWILSEYGSPYLMLSPPSGDATRFQELFINGPGLHAAKVLRDTFKSQEGSAEQRAQGTRQASGLEYRILIPSQVPESIAI